MPLKILSPNAPSNTDLDTRSNINEQVYIGRSPDVSTRIKVSGEA